MKEEHLINHNAEHNLICHESPDDIIGRKLYYISDLHLNLKERKGFGNLSDEEYIQHAVRKMDGNEPFGDSPLIILGDVADDKEMVEYFFSVLRMRREGHIVYVLGNHECEPHAILNETIEAYRTICNKHQIILLQNEIAFFYDVRTDNGEILPFREITVLSPEQILDEKNTDLYDYAKKSKLIIYGSIGLGERIYGVEEFTDDTAEINKCFDCYKRIEGIFKDTQVIVATHYPYDAWSDLDYNPSYIYLSGHTHFDYFEYSDRKTVFSDNQVGYYSDDFFLKYFKVSAQYDPFIGMKDGIHKVKYEEYIDFQIGNNIKVKKKEDEKQIYMIKRSGTYMFVYYNYSNELVLLNGGAKQKLSNTIEFYYANLETYATGLKNVLKNYSDALINVSYYIKNLGGFGKIHGCIVDIDHNNHIYVNPEDGKITPYYSDDSFKKIVYENLDALLCERCPAMHKRMKAMEGNEAIPSGKSFNENSYSESITDSSIYNVSRVIRRIQYLIFQNIVRYWNDDVFSKIKNREIYNALSKIDS